MILWFYCSLRPDQTVKIEKKLNLFVCLLFLFNNPCKNYRMVFNQ